MLKRRVFVVAALVVTFAGVSAAAEQPAGKADQDAVLNVGGLQRDLPPQKLIPSTARPPALAAEGYPQGQGIEIRKSPLGVIYVDANGMSLYIHANVGFGGGGGNGLLPASSSGRSQAAANSNAGATARGAGGAAGGRAGAFGPPPAGPAAERWTPVAAPADAKPIGAWKTVAGANGPQWTYGGSTVYTFRGDKVPGDLKGHEFEDIWMAINWVPPIPRTEAPLSVYLALVLHRTYVLTNPDGHPLYAYAELKDCKIDCAGLSPLVAGMASRNVGDWTVVRNGDWPQWAYRGKPVYFNQAAMAADLKNLEAVLHL